MTIFSLVISIITCILLMASVLFFPSIKVKNKEIKIYWIICLIGALILVISTAIPGKEIQEQLLSNSSINPLKILALFFSMTILSIFLDEIGLFKYLASKAARLGKSNQVSLFIVLYFLASLLTVFTSNDIVILTFTPFICYFCKNAKINPLPYLVGEFAAANTWSMMLIIGNPTNIYLATACNINFIDYLSVMYLPTLSAGIVEIVILLVIFRKLLKEKIELEFEEVRIEDRISLIIGLIHLITCLILLVISSYIGFEMYLISFICACSEIVCFIVLSSIRKKGWNVLKSVFKRLPYELIPFVLSMFIIVSTLNYRGISEQISSLLANSYPIFTYGSLSFIFCNIMNNIPMSVLFSSLPMASLPYDQAIKAIYATIIGSNIGAFLTPVGALAGIMFTNLTKSYQVDYTFKDFVKYGIIISIPTIATALGVLYLVMK